MPRQKGTRQKKACCTPGQDAAASQAADVGVYLATMPAHANSGSTEGMTRIAGGPFLMGAEDDEIWPTDGEAPVRQVVVDPLWIDTHAVTNQQFAEFVRDTGYVTDAEKYGWSFVHQSQLETKRRPKEPMQTVQGLDWWVKVDGACWKRPKGPDTKIGKIMDHPVVHVTWNDAVAYADWAGKRLPYEAEWERAARGGEKQLIYPWGNELTPNGEHFCNIWQGAFPKVDSGEDGFKGTAPVDSFPPNGFGLRNVVGNVWEWCADWFSPNYRSRDSRKNPKGPPKGQTKMMKGGSYLCHRSYCNRYRNSARTSNTPDSSTGNLGFRCARDL